MVPLGQSAERLRLPVLFETWYKLRHPMSDWNLWMMCEINFRIRFENIKQYLFVLDDKENSSQFKTLVNFGMFEHICAFHELFLIETGSATAPQEHSSKQYKKSNLLIFSKAHWPCQRFFFGLVRYEIQLLSCWARICRILSAFRAREKSASSGSTVIFFWINILKPVEMSKFSHTQTHFPWN